MIDSFFYILKSFVIFQVVLVLKREASEFELSKKNVENF